MNLLKMCGPQTLLCLWYEMFRARTGFGKVFSFLCCCFCCVFTILSKNTLFATQFCNFICNFNLFSILVLLQDLWPIIRLWRYRPSLFKLSSSKNFFEWTFSHDVAEKRAANKTHFVYNVQSIIIILYNAKTCGLVCFFFIFFRKSGFTLSICVSNL